MGRLNEQLLIDLKISGEILDYEINENGVKIIKKFKIKSYDL